MSVFYLPGFMVVSIDGATEGITVMLPTHWRVWAVQRHLAELVAFYS